VAMQVGIEDAAGVHDVILRVESAPDGTRSSPPGRPASDLACFDHKSHPALALPFVQVQTVD
jgi:hypothetical protein